MRPNKGLDWKFYSPWLIKRVIDHKAYELDIPSDKLDEGLTPVFHPWKLHLCSNNPYPGQVIEPGDDFLTFDDGEGSTHNEWVVCEILDFRETRRWGVQYKATFDGEWEEWNANPHWLPWTNFLHAKDLILEYHHLHLHKPPPPEDLISWVPPESIPRDNARTTPPAHETSPLGGGGSVRPQPEQDTVRRNPTRRTRARDYLT